MGAAVVGGPEQFRDEVIAGDDREASVRLDGAAQSVLADSFSACGVFPPRPFWNYPVLPLPGWGRGCNLGHPTVTLLWRKLSPEFPALHLLGPVATGVDAGLPVRPPPLGG